jgi:prepilin peptidase CpaA
MALMLPGHLLGATGAGDVKLFGAVGALLGPSGIMFAFIYTALSGGVLALLVAARRRRVRQTLTGTAKFIASVGTSKAEIEHSAAGNRFAYAPAIAIGAVLAALR